ncbi:hypothetical protein E2562_011261 [Oryza meyeriana var. granulata]|uniref:Deacetylase sirtuin-type domain-containing protein n=1 Tax=Oryza meyeriana var. granulata TaxID=110450 RepID=A0A6G1BVI3_9ORYZ|nr:hypothetical protein E2562_011261 [Oryza meyeriana var. granulata]
MACGTGEWRRRKQRWRLRVAKDVGIRCDGRLAARWAMASMSLLLLALDHCGTSIDRESFQEQVKDLNPKWALAIDSLEVGQPGSDKNFGMQQRPDGDIEIDEKFWEQDFDIPSCNQCDGVLKPDVVMFGDDVPEERAESTKEAARNCDALLVVGSALMTMSAFRLARFPNSANMKTSSNIEKDAPQVVQVNH